MTAATRLVYVDVDLWRQMAEARNVDTFCASWLALQCSMLAGVSQGVVVLGEADTGPFRPVATWPAGKSAAPTLVAAAERTLAEGSSQVMELDRAGSSRTGSSIAYPIIVDGHTHGVVAVDVRDCAPVDIETALRQLQWGCAWLEVFLRRQRFRDATEVNESTIAALDLIALTLAQDSFRAAALAFVTALAARLDCDCVSIGFLRGGHTRLAAMSHSARTGEKMNLSRAVGAAMDEALDRRSIIASPSLPGLPPAPDHAHAALARERGTAVLSIPLYRNADPCGVLTLERSGQRPFDTPALELCKSVAAITAPMLDHWRSNDRLLVAKVAETARVQLGRLFGPAYLLRKLVVGLLVLAAVFLSVDSGEYRVSADARIEGSVRRVISAPLDGYVVAAEVRAGDLVRQGELIFRLDDRDLALDRVQILAEQAQIRGQAQDAAASHDRAKVQVLNAQLEQSAAQLALLDEQLARTQISAPFDGLIVSGDLSQSLGASVRRGENLFEITPLTGYRVILEVDEHDVEAVRQGQQGRLVLSALPGEPLEFTVSKITPVASASEGLNYFRVEADLAETSARLRPGMEGVGKIAIEQRRLIWIWTHEPIARIRLWLWRWLP